MAGIIVSNNSALPRDIDVTVNVSKVAAEVTTDLSVLCFVTPNAPFDHGAGRIRFYTSLSSLLDDFATSSEAYKAAPAFFSQTPRSKTFAVGRIFTTAQAGFLQCGVLGNHTLAEWQAITSGAFKITFGGVTKAVSSVSFAALENISGIPAILETAIRAADASTAFTAATVTLDSNGCLRITNGDTGDASTVGYLAAPDSGTDISGVDYLNGAEIVGAEVQAAYSVPGYTPAGIESEIEYVRQAAAAQKKFLYGWALDATYRDDDDAVKVAANIEAQTYGILGLVTNTPLAKSADSTTDVGAVVFASGYRCTFVVYHNNAYYYPEVSILAYALSVDYSMQNSVITTKFKSLQGIPTVPITESELAVLNSKRINTYTAVGNSSRTFREGTEADENWYIDDLINLDNFREELQASVYNVFLANKKVPYNSDGSTLIYTAIAVICDRYVYNGTFSSRELADAEQLAKGRTYDPPYTITITPIKNMTIAQRAQRIGPPAHVAVNLSGAMHSININVEATA